jgi:hypothetical protein
MRSMIGFLIAPLVVPGIYATCVLHDILVHAWAPIGILVLIVTVVALITYGGVILLGIPAYVLLRSFGLTAFWIAPVTGFIVGAITDWMAIVFFLPPAFADHLLREMALGSLYGAVVGTFLWLIARPDRQSQANA